MFSSYLLRIYTTQKLIIIATSLPFDVLAAANISSLAPCAIHSQSSMASASFEGHLPVSMRASEAAVSTVTDVVARLGADCTEGLREEEVERRRKVFGKNEFVIKKEEPVWRKYLNQVRRLLLLLLLSDAICSSPRFVAALDCIEWLIR